MKPEERVVAVHRASLTRDVKFGAALWLDGRCVARVYSDDIKDSMVTPEQPLPKWERDAMVFVDAVNRRPLAALDEAEALLRDIRAAFASGGVCDECKFSERIDAWREGRAK